MGSAIRVTECVDKYDEMHVVIEMHDQSGTRYWLDWIGAEYAQEPDELECFNQDNFFDIAWEPVTEAMFAPR